MAQRPRIYDLLDRQGEALGSLEDREVRGFLRAYEDARRELAEDLARMEAAGLDVATPFTAQHLRVTLAQVEAGITRLERRLGTALSTSVDKTRTQALQDLLRVVAAQEPGFRDAGGRIEHEVLRRFTESRGLLLHEHSIQRYGRDAVSRIQRELVIGVTRGQTWRQIAKRITDAENSVLAGMRYRGELIVRMELNGAYNDAHLTSIQEAGKVLDEAHPGDPLLKKADEFRDLRNHALSRVLDGQVQPADQPFKVSVARVEAEHAALQSERARRKLPPRKLTGILWEQQGGFYVGMNYPAHFWERGRIVPWRRSWEEVAERGPRAAAASVAPAAAMLTVPKERTAPSLPPDPSAVPGGRRSRARANDDPARKWSALAENEIADLLARSGFVVEQNPPRRPNGLRPDFLVDGRYMDCIAPTRANARNIWSETLDKVRNRQADRVIIHLGRSKVTLDQLRHQFSSWGIEGLKEVVAVVDGNLVWVL